MAAREPKASTKPAASSATKSAAKKAVKKTTKKSAKKTTKKLPEATPAAKKAVKKTTKKSAKKTTKKLPGATPAAKRVVKPAAGKTSPSQTASPAPDWRDAAIARWRALLLEVAPDVREERKWIKPTNPEGVAAWSRHGLIATGEKYKGVAKITFAHGASFADPAKLFNAGLGGGTRRAIDLREGERVDARAFKALAREAVAFDDAHAAKTTKR